MRAPSAAILFCAILMGTLIACTSASRPPVEIDNVTIYAPLPGSNMSVAYLALRNNTAEPIAVTRVSSPQFGRIEMHESTLAEGIARMQKLDALVAAPRSSLLLQQNGKHLMLMDPIDSLTLDQPISLRLHTDTAGEIVVRSPLQSRVQLDE